MAKTNIVSVKEIEDLFLSFDGAGVKRDISDMDDPEDDASPTKKVMPYRKPMYLMLLEAHCWDYLCLT